MAEAATTTDTAAAATSTGATTTTDTSVATTSTAAAVTDKAATATTIIVDTAKLDAAKTEPAKPYWPEDWQKRIAGDDEKELKQVARYQSPADIWKKARSLEQRLSSGELKPTLQKDATQEEIAAWRKESGIPDKPESYDLTGVTIPEADKTFISDFLTRAHQSNMTPDQAKAAVSAYYDNQAKAIQARKEADETQRTAALDALNSEWGGTFRRNVNMVDGLLAKFPESVRDALKSARMPDGTAVFNSADVLKGFAALALELNPAGIVVPASGGDLGKTALEEYKQIQKDMRENRTAYNKDAGKQARFTSLIEYLTKSELIDGQGNEIVKKAA